MEAKLPMSLVPRDVLIEKGNQFKKKLPGVSDLSVIGFLETLWIVEFCEDLPTPADYRTTALKIFGLIFQRYREEVLADPPTLCFVVVPVEQMPGPLDPLMEQLEQLAKQWEAARVAKLVPHNNSAKISNISSQTPPAVTRTHPDGASASNSQGFVDAASSSSRIPVTMAPAKSPIDSDPKIHGKEAGSSNFTTNARLNWQPSKSDDPFGDRVSTYEFASGYPFELANRAKHENVRDNILYDVGYRNATACFAHLPDPIIQPLQPGADRTPSSAKAHIAANNARTEAAKAEIEIAKAKELRLVGAQEITTARGIREEILSAGPTFYDTVCAAMTAAGEDPVARVDGNVAFAYLKNEAITERRAAMKAEAMAREFDSTVIKEQKYTAQGPHAAQGSFTAQSYAYSTSDAPTEEQELPGKGLDSNIANRTLDKAQMQYNMMYQVVTQMQRDRLELGPEVSDYEVISRAHAGYVSTEKEEAAALARAAEVQKTKALAISVKEQLLKAQAEGKPVTRMGNLDLSQKDIADVLARCNMVGDSAAAANDYINMREQFEKVLDNDPFFSPSDLNPEAANPFTIKDLIEGARIGITENKRMASKFAANKDQEHFDAAAAKIETDIRLMKEFKSKLGTTPRDFSLEILEIQKELAELKAHRDAYPGDPADLVPDVVDDPGYMGIGVRPDDFGGQPEQGGADGGAAAADATATGAGEARKLSRAEQRRVARQKAKGKGKASG